MSHVLDALRGKDILTTMNFNEIFRRRKPAGATNPEKETGTRETRESDITAKEVLERFPGALAEIFPKAQQEAEKDKSRTVYLVAINGELLLDTNEIASFLDTLGVTGDKSANTRAFYAHLNKGGEFPKRVKTPVADPRDAGRWLEPYTYPAFMKGWRGKSGGSDYDENTGEPIWYFSITTGRILGAKEVID